MKLVCLILLYCMLATKIAFAGFKLITVLYNEPIKERMQEYIVCLENNLKNPYIDSIIVLYDISKDDTKNALYNYLQHQPVKIITINGRPTYGECFEIANTLFYEEVVILSNADIYFNQTIAALAKYDMNNKFLALTRWNVQKDGTIKPYLWPQNITITNYPKAYGAEYSQDVWIFKSPLKKFMNDSIKLGTVHCDGRIAYEAKRAGLEVVSPSLTIQSCHLHLSGVRNYENVATMRGNDCINVPWSEIS